MARGAVAKQIVEDKIRTAFGKDFVGIDTANKKIYVQAEEDNEMVQIAITLTCPKTPFVTDGKVAGDGFAEGNFGEPDVYKPAEMTDNELENVRKLIKELGL